MKKLLFVTSNGRKFSEAESILKEYGVIIEHRVARIGEVRAEDCETVARHAAEEAFSRFGKPLFVEDSGLFITSLGGFPGPYSAWVKSKLGNAGVLRLMKGVRDRRAVFVGAVAFRDGKRAKLFVGKCPGRIAEKETDQGGFGFDPIFIPEGHSKTFAQAPELKETLSHRALALRKLAFWLAKSKRD
ncbi:MAG: RdgB/HAM1 family non-canonical purine NTP pyrophosphatase [Candidatus Micrarchaeota archaeon]|nr:RdgB/HAM1 family non-canonical purine NTP pyrophosphatase [Candidatus Micrarchaeota archaeon]